MPTVAAGARPDMLMAITAGRLSGMGMADTVAVGAVVAAGNSQTAGGFGPPFFLVLRLYAGSMRRRNPFCPLATKATGIHSRGRMALLELILPRPMSRTKPIRHSNLQRRDVCFLQVLSTDTKANTAIF
jgi:hypothetical protein